MNSDGSNVVTVHINPLKPNGNYTSYLYAAAVNNSSICIYVFHIILPVNTNYFL
jgi:hypothetical protein